MEVSSIELDVRGSGIWARSAAGGPSRVRQDPRRRDTSRFKIISQAVARWLTDPFEGLPSRNPTIEIQSGMLELSNWRQEHATKLQHR